jgi:tetratricopeptide (TPR) repeat protein
MAPEQLRGAADQRSDIYALGLTLYELLTLRPALDDTERNHRLDGPEPLPPRKIDPAIPRDLETIVLKCLAHEPAQRYPTAAALEADLRRFLDDKPIRARRASWVERSWRWGRRNPALAAVSAVAAVLLLVVGATALTGSIQTRRAHAAATTALGRAEATSRLALAALEDIYLQLSPERVWISSNSEPGGDVCPCVGLRSTAGSAASEPRPIRPVQVSQETASLLQNLLVFYDRLAEQVPSSTQVLFESAIASRRVGDIRQRLGQMDQAEHEYARAVAKLTALNGQPDADVAIRGELARTYNELGNVRSAKFEYARAHEMHRRALSALGSSERTAGLPSEYRYELARTLYFLARQRSNAGSGHGDDAGESVAATGPHRERSDEYRQQAIRILDQLTQENPDAADCRFLLALCHRPSAIGPVPFERSADREGRERAIRILEELKIQYPGVVDYRYELAATYAWVPVGLYPWQRPAAVPAEVERNLRKALDESRWLVAHNPTIPDYARSQALVLAKLGTVCWRNQRLAEADDFFQQALQAQDAVITEFPDLPAHNRLLLEFIRLRLGQVRYERRTDQHASRAVGEARELLETCIENLTQLTKRPALAADRLARSSLPLARETLSRALAETSAE